MRCSADALLPRVRPEYDPTWPARQALEGYQFQTDWPLVLLLTAVHMTSDHLERTRRGFSRLS